MIDSEAAELLTYCGLIDGRETTRLAAQQWAQLLANVTLTDAVEAARRHYSVTHDRIMPADILSGVRAIRNLRIARQEEPPPDADPDQPREYVEALRAGRVRMAELELADNPAGKAKVLELVSGVVPPKPPAADYVKGTQTRRMQDAVTTAARENNLAIEAKRETDEIAKAGHAAMVEAARRELHPEAS